MLSTTLAFALTVAFVLTGAFALARLVALTSGSAGAGEGCDRLPELSHLVMSVAMIAMVWGLGGGPDTPSGVVQLVVFGLFGLCFLALTVRPAPGHGRPEGAYHLLMVGSMVWMVAAMPLLMGSMSSDGAGHDGPAGHDTGSMPGMSVAASPSGTPGWATAVSTLLVVALAAAVVFWGSRVLRPVADPSRPAETGAPATTRLATAHSTRSLLLDRRAGALCHVLMSAGMAGMLTAML